MKKLLATILTLLMLPCASSFAGDVEIGSEDKASEHVKPGKQKSQTSHENNNDDDDYPPEGNNR